MFPLLWCLITFVLQRMEMNGKKSLSYPIGNMMFGLFFWLDLQITIGRYLLRKSLSKGIKRVADSMEVSFFIRELGDVSSIVGILNILTMVKDFMTDCGLYLFCLLLIYGY